MESAKKPKKQKKSVDSTEYYKKKDQQIKSKMTVFVLRGVTFRSVIIFFILFNLIFSYLNKFKAGWILSSILLIIEFSYMIIEILINKKKIPKFKKFIQRMKVFYLDVALIVLIFTMSVILFFSIVNQPRHWSNGFPKE